MNLFLARNGTGCSVKDTGNGFDLYHGRNLWIQGIPEDTSPVTLLSAINAAPQQGAEVPAQYQGPGLGRQFLEAGVWGAGVTGGSILMSSALFSLGDALFRGDS
jgi:hypothetical protein